VDQWGSARYRPLVEYHRQYRYVGPPELRDQAPAVGSIAADIQAWTRLLGLYDQPDLVTAEPETLRYRLLHLPAKLTTHARRRWFTVSETWPWAEAFLLRWQRLSLIPTTA
jgi:hypothetical protein